MKVQSNGLGQQSVALYLMSSLGIVERFDFSVFADPGREKRATYRYLDWLKKWAKKNDGVEIIHDDSKNLWEDLRKASNSTGQRWVSIPAYTESGGMVRRQCTSEYKIRVVERVIRERQGKRVGQIFDPVRLYFGISYDELHRMNGPERRRVTQVYPFCGYEHDGKKMRLIQEPHIDPMTRSQIQRWLTDAGFEIPPKSSCVFCPYMSNINWREMKKNEPEDFADAMEIDERIRDSSGRGIRDKLFLHQSRVPLADANLQEDQHELQFDCYGYCNT